ncbi:Piso0_002666 [Millerozyma farinosa CBS 7064]|uniref:Piso0_002666 protein n=1 Tax=Pichia sorbitophila (strain ATCC MYA-4447 / BCRC 22081 / CBS 7064 / NBRC 10061 / NRRL Y-12695) TaxID=559304 RepID=G8YFM9_PICSO|nr:Piso0_002666 [Millerozyma farinosa CBS 7064]
MKRKGSITPDIKQKKLRGREGFDEIAVDTWIAVGNCSITLGLITAAIKSFEFALGHQPVNAEALRQLSHCLRLQDMQNNEIFGSLSAIEKLTRALEEHKELNNDSGLFKELAECYLTMGFVEEAQQAVQRSMQLDENDPSVWLLNAETLIRKNDRAQAANCLMRCLSMLPESLAQFTPENIEIARSAHAELAAISAADGNIELSIAELTVTLSLPPPPLSRIDEHFALWCALATAKERTNDIQGALRACEGAESILGDSPRILMTHAYLLLIDYSQENAEKAIKVTQKIIDAENVSESSSEGDFLPWYLMGKAYSILGSPRLAYDCYQVALRRASNSPITWLAVGKLYLQLRQLPDALAAYSQALRLHIDENSHATALAWDGLSCVYEQSEDQLMDASDACARAAACFKSIGDVDSANFFEERARNLMLASKKEISPPAPRECPDVPNFLIRDYVALLPAERIALVQGSVRAAGQFHQQQENASYQATTSSQGQQSPPNRPHSTVPAQAHAKQQYPQQSPPQLFYPLPQPYKSSKSSTPRPASQQVWSPNQQANTTFNHPQYPSYMYHQPPPGVQMGPLPVPQMSHRSPLNPAQVVPGGVQYSLAPMSAPGPVGPPPPPPGYSYGQYGPIVYASPANNWQR